MPLLKLLFRILLLKWLWRLVGGFVSLTALWVLAYRYTGVPTTPQMFAADSTLYQWTPAAELPNELRKAVLLAEDIRFALRSDLNLAELRNYLKVESQSASTVDRALRSSAAQPVAVPARPSLPRQCAENVFLWKGDGPLHDGLAAYFTLLVEVLWPKERTLVVFLNTVPMGAGTFGAAGAAARHYKKRLQELAAFRYAYLVARIQYPTAEGKAYAAHAQHIATAVQLLPDEFFGDLLLPEQTP